MFIQFHELLDTINSRGRKLQIHRRGLSNCGETYSTLMIMLLWFFFFFASPFFCANRWDTANCAALFAYFFREHRRWTRQFIIYARKRMSPLIYAVLSSDKWCQKKRRRCFHNRLEMHFSFKISFDDGKYN